MAASRAVSFSQVNIRQGFWQKHQQLNRDVTIPAVRDRFAETGRFNALQCAWREGAPNKPHIFWDSDVAKWIESVAYLRIKQPVGDLEQFVEQAIDQLERNQTEDGYVNSYFTGIEPTKRWFSRDAHELYCAGHLIEAAIAWKNATGHDRFLKIMCRYADAIDSAFRTGQTVGFATPSHPEIELALVKLYHATGNEKYLALSKWFIDQRGANTVDPDEPLVEKQYKQSHRPCREQTTAEGHAVRACYLFCGMADIAREYADAELQHACELLFDNITQKRMYITGGIGSTHVGEAFTADYDLPGQTAYTETCAAVSLAFFAQRMLLLSVQGKYADIVERILYNGFLSGLSLDGRSFFYTNPLEIDMRNQRVHRKSVHGGEHGDWLPAAQRVESFFCSCCPPNITRFIASIGDYLFTENDDTIFIHQYMNSISQIGGAKIEIETDYPVNGEVYVYATGLGGRNLALRIPGWCKQYMLNEEHTLQDGYAFVACAEDRHILLLLEIKPQLIEANPNVAETAGKIALMRGPVVYCLEGCDNGGTLHDLHIDPLSAVKEDVNPLNELPLLLVQGWQRQKPDRYWLYKQYQGIREPVTMKFIPYFTFANRGECDMRVWVLVT